MAHLRVADLAGRVNDDRAVLLEHGRGRHVLVPREGTDGDRVAVLLNVREIVEPPEVDEEGRPREPELHRRQKRVAAREELGVLVLPEELDRVVDALGDLVVEPAGITYFTSSIAFQTPPAWPGAARP